MTRKKWRTAWFAEDTEDGQYWYLRDQHGFIMKPSEAKEIVKGLQKFIDEVSDEEIQKSNNELWDEIHKDGYSR